METFYSRITGKLLGSGTIKSNKDNLFYFQCIHSQKDACWANYCYEQLEERLPFQQPFWTHSKTGAKRYVIQSEPSPLLENLYDNWYQKNQKQLPFALIEKYMTRETLAWWYQDHGHLKKRRGQTIEKLLLSTSRFTKEQLQLLILLLIKIFGLHFSYDEQKRLVLYDALQIHYFLSLVAPYMQPCMKRKMKTVTPLKKIANRTTITLTKNIVLQSPTKDINDTLHHYLPLIKPSFNEKKRWINQRFEKNETKSYQIKLSKSNKQRIQTLIAQTGLTMNEVVQEAFLEKEKAHPKRLQSLDELSTTQQHVLLGSILGDGTLRYRFNKDGTKKSSYYEHYGIQQYDYRKWKVDKLTPYIYFLAEPTRIGSREHLLFSKLESIFYTKNREKILHYSFIKQFTDLHLLATLYLDDGSLTISHRINHNLKKIYLLPHVSLYIQSFRKKELDQLAQLIQQWTKATIVPTKRPDGHGYYLKTSKVKDTFLFLDALLPATKQCPSMFYKTNWTYRLYKEKEKWKKKYPHYEIVTSSSERYKNYSQEEIQTMIQMKRNGSTDKEIAQAINRTYWAVVYKLRELRQKKKL